MAVTSGSAENHAGSVFVGRDRELAELLAGLRDRAADRGALFLITGDPGIGKTALAGRLATHAHRRGARVLWGRCWEGGGAPPYWPWIQILRSLSDAYDEDTLRTHLGRGASHIAHLVPELGQLPARAPAIPAFESDAARLWLFEAVATFLANASPDQPLVLIIDDLHAADPSSLLLLRFLARDVRSTGLLMVAAYRDVEATQSPESAPVLADLAGEGHVISLRGLSLDEVGRLVEQYAGAPPLAEKLAAIHRATDGNPLFVREVTRLVAAGDPLDHHGELRLAIPDSVRAVIRRRLAPLSADAVGVLGAAAVVGRDFDLALVAAARDLPVERVLASLSEAVALGVVVEEANTVGAYRFAHPLMRDVIYEGLPIPARVQLHQRIGEAIERLGGQDVELHLAELAHHFAKAAASGQAAKAGEYARRAGDRAMASCAYEDAAAAYGRALEALDFAEPDEAVRCELLLRRGGAQARAGDYQTAKGTHLRAAEIARRLGDPEQLGRAALGFGEPQVEGGLVDRRLVALLHEALDRLSADEHPLRARMLARLSLELAFAEAEPRESSSRQAVEMARRLGDAASLAGALRARWMAVWGPDGLDERLALEREMLQVAAEAGDPEMELVGRARRITSLLQAADIRAVETEIAAHARLASEVRIPFHAWTAATLRAMQALLHGSLAEAGQLADEALSLEPSRPNVRFAHLDLVTLIRWERDRLGELRERWRQAVEQFPLFGYARGWLCLADAESGRHDLAEQGLRSLAEQLPELPRNGVWLPAAALTCLAAARLDAPDAAATVYPLLLPYEGQTVVIPTPHPVVCFGSAALYLALLAATMSLDEADDHFGAAMDVNARLGARSLLVRTEYEYARMLVRRGRAADRNRAHRLLDRAAGAATAIGMVQVGKGIEQLRAGEHGAAIAAERAVAVPVEAAGGAATAAYVFRREGDYWTIAFDEGPVVRLRDSKGLRCLARLLASPGQEIHVVDLEAADSGEAGLTPTTSRQRSEAAELTVRADLGDAGELLDAQAKAAYRARLRELQAELDEAEGFNDPARAAAAREEMDFLTSELARAVGLGGRDRKAASHAERARLNVTRAIRAAMRNLGRADPALGRHLAATIRTGRYCSYTPDPRAPVTWDS